MFERIGANELGLKISAPYIVDLHQIVSTGTLNKIL